MANPLPPLARAAATGSLEKGSYVKQRNRRKMAMAGTAVFGGLVIGTVAAAAGGTPVTEDISVSRLQSPSVVAPGVSAAVPVALPTDPVAIAALVKAVGGQTLTAASEGAPVTVVVPDAPAAAAAAPAPAPAPEPAPAPAPPPAEVEAEPVVVEAAPPAPAPTGSVEEAIAAWFPDVYGEAVAVADCESSMNPGAVSRGGANHGLFQINNVHRGNFEAVTGQPWDAVYDPYYNSQYARQLYDSSGWRPWTCQP